MSKFTEALKFVIGLIILAAGILLLIYYWNDFLVMLKGIVGIIVIFIGLGITMMGYFGLKG